MKIRREMKSLISFFGWAVAQVPEAMVTNLNEMYYEGTQAYYDVSTKFLVSVLNLTSEKLRRRSTDNRKVFGKLENASKYRVFMSAEVRGS